MPRMENKAVSGKKGSPPQDESGSGDMKITDLFRRPCERMDSCFDKQENRFKEMDSRLDEQKKSCFDRWCRKLDVMVKDW